MAKVFFFACLDKMTNFMLQLKMAPDEDSAWRQLLDPQVMSGSLTTFLATVPGTIGKSMSHLNNHLRDTLANDRISAQDLRDLRNTHHGYRLRANIVARLMESPGEFDNDLTLMLTSWVLYLLAQKWQP